MNEDVSQRLLAKLFDRWQGQGEIPTGRAITLVLTGRDGNEYFSTAGEARRRLHATLENAEHCGAITLEWGRFSAAHELRRIVLTDGMRLAEFLGKRPASASIAMLDKSMRPLLAGCTHEWIIDAYDSACKRWAKGEPVFRLRLAEDNREIRNLFIALDAVACEKHRGLDMRTFSARYLSDSKALERLLGAFAQAWMQFHDIEYREPEDLLSSLGLEKMPQPVLLRGCIFARIEKQTSDLSILRPFFGIAAEQLATLRPARSPAYLITIENLTSFQRYCREINDDGLVVFSGGFPNLELQDFLAALDHDLPQTIPFYHWGDTDVRGLEIMRTISRRCPLRTISAHLMSRDPWMTERRVTPSEVKVLNKLAKIPDACGILANQMIAHGIPEKFEQESVSPASPLHDYSVCDTIAPLCHSLIQS